MRATVGLAALFIVGGLAGAARPVHAQSLADLARKEEARRKEIKDPAKVYTNKDLGVVPAAPVVAPPDSLKPSSSTDGADDSDAKDAKPKGPVKDQAYWSGRKKELQSKLERDQVYADALQSRISALTADFSSHDDPVQRSGIERDRIKALAELDSLQASIKNGKKALDDLDEEARKAGVPPGWLR